MSQFFSYIIMALCVLFPIYFWSYALTLLGDNDKTTRLKFWAGVFSWIFSVGITFIFAKFFQEINTLIFVAVFFWLLGFLYCLIFLITGFGSSVSRLFLRKISFLHLSVMFFLFLLFLFLGKFFHNFFFSGILLTIFLPAFFEEISKHFSMLWLLGKKFSFSLRDLTIFTFCVVLGFVFVENILYFFKYWASVWLAFSRSIFVFSVHLLCALVAMLAWWKALEYPLVSIKYFAYFSLGFLWASVLHFLYNYTLSLDNNILFVPYLLGAYGLFVYLLKK